MFNALRIKIARSLASAYLRMLEESTEAANKRAQEAEFAADRRYAEFVLKTDPFELLAKKFNIVFSQEYERVEEKLDTKGQLGFKMWAYQATDDIYFNYLIDWIINTAGNETMKRAPISAERTQYGRAQISNMILLRKEVGRLASLYKEELDKHKGDDFDPSKSVEY